MHGNSRQQLEQEAAAVDRCAERYQVFLDVVSGAGSQRDIADKWRIDRTTVAYVCKVAKQGALDALAASRPGRPGKSAAELALDDALAEVSGIDRSYRKLAHRGSREDRVHASESTFGAC